MRLLPRILKSSTFTVDDENKVLIDIMPPHEEILLEADETEALGEDVPEEPKGPTPEEILVKAKNEAEAIVRDAEAQAEALRLEAEKTAAELAEKQAAESRKTGHAEGYAEGVAEAQVLKENAQRVLDEAYAERQRILEGAEGDVLALIDKVVRKLLADTKRVHPQVILTLIREGLVDAPGVGNITIRISQDDYSMVAAKKDEIAKRLDGSTAFEIVKDLSLNPSDCIIETPYGNIDCSLDRQMQDLIENLYYIHEHDGG